MLQVILFVSLSLAGCSLFSDPSGGTNIAIDSGTTIGDVNGDGEDSSTQIDLKDMPKDIGVETSTTSDANPDSTMDGNHDSDSAPDVRQLCGNGVLDPGEQCDGEARICSNLNAGHDGGSAACNTDCSADVSQCYACDYFFEPINGSDSNDGRTSATAFQTLAKVNELGLATSPAGSGTIICLSAGSTFSTTTQVSFRVAGTAADPLIVTSYGDPSDLPTISGAVPLTFSVSGGRYVATYTQPIGRLSIDGVTKEEASDSTLTDGDWFKSGDLVFYDGPAAPVNAIAGIPRLVALNQGSMASPFTGVTFSGLKFEHARRAFLLPTNGNGLDDIEIVGNSFNEISEIVYTTLFNGNVRRLRFQNNVITAGDTLVRSNPLNTFTISEVIIQRNISTDPKTHDTWTDPVNLRNSHDVLVTQNVFEGAFDNRGSAIIISSTNGKTENYEISDNMIDGFANGIFFRNDGQRDFTNVTIHNNIVARSSVGIKLDVATPNDNTFVEHNTLYFNDTSLVLESDVAGINFRNNWSVPSNDGDHIRVSTTAAFTSDYNLFATGSFRVNGTTLSLAEWIATARDANSITEVIPQFTNVAPTSPTDFIPLAIGAAIGAGDTSSVNTDFGGRPRSTNDIGAWERQPTD